jgi:hypothetical protein
MKETTANTDLERGLEPLRVTLAIGALLLALVVFLL